MNVITIDGPSAAGKGTLSVKLASFLKCLYLDSGLIYRQMAFWLMHAGVRPDNEIEVLNFVNEQLQHLDWESLDLSSLRAPEVSDFSSKISVFPLIRERANAFQREFVAQKNQWVIVDGRDAGTVVFPDAAVKLFITAAPDIRAKRRFNQLKAAGRDVDLAAIEKEIFQRDLRDQNRNIAPLKPAPDAYIIDTSIETEDETANRILKYLEKYVLA